MPSVREWRDKRIVQDHSIRMTQREFDALLTYSTTLPTGITIGKRWKASHRIYGWRVGEYYELPESHPHAKTDVGIRWYYPVIITDA